MRLTSKSAGAVFCTALLLLLILFEIRAHNRLHSDDIVGGGGDGGGGGWSGLGFAELAAIHDPVEARLAALEAKIDEIAARQAAQVDELGAKLTASLAHLDGQLGRLDARTGNGGQPGAGAGASTGAPHKDGKIDTRDDVGKRPLPIDFNGKFKPSCCNFSLVQERIDRIQNSTCNGRSASDKSHLVYFYLTSHGFGVDIMGNIANVMWQRALTRGLPFWVSDKHWHYAKGVCEDESLGCYFKHVGWNCVPGIKPYAFGESLDGLCCSKERLQYFAYEYLTQPLPKYQQLLESRAESMRVPHGEPCAALHVRRGDSLLNKGYNNSGTAVYRNVSVAEYMEDARPWLDHFKVKHMLLMSDDADAVIESRAFAQYTWHTLDRKRFTSANGVGWENHFPAGSRATEVVDILALRAAVRPCSLLIGSQSQFGISLWKGMMAHKDAPFVYVETRARNLLYKDGDSRQTTKFAAPPYAANAKGMDVSTWAKLHG